jgi:hypothetical protein
MTVGITAPVQLVVIGLPNDTQMGKITHELQLANERGVIQILDLLPVQKTLDGTIISLHGGDLTPDQRMGYGGLIARLMGYQATTSSEESRVGADLAANRMYRNRRNHLRGFTEKIPPSTTALLVLLENRWASSLHVAHVQMEFGGIGVIVVREAIETAGGVLLSQGLVPAETLEDLGADVAVDLAATQHVETFGPFNTPAW